VNKTGSNSLPAVSRTAVFVANKQNGNPRKSRH
jgi:hypothetical protein